MTGVNFHDKNNYAAHFRELLSLHKDSNIIALVQDELPQQPQQDTNTSRNNSNFLLSFFLVPTTVQTSPVDYQKQIKKLFRKKIEKWNENLDLTLEDIRYSPKLLQDLKKIIRTIFEESKVKILEEKLKENFLLDTKTEKLLYRLQILINRILSTPSTEKWKIRPRNIFHISRKESAAPELIKTPRRQLNGLLLPKLPDTSHISLKYRNSRDIRRVQSDSILWESSERCPTSSEVEKTFIDSRELYDLIQKQKRSLHHQQRASEISLYSHEMGNNWREKLINAFAELNEEGAICALGEKLSTIQVMQIFKRFQDDQKHEWKIIFLLGSIKYTTFVEMIQSLDLDVINFLNEILQRSREDSIQWFQEAFNVFRDGFISSCNRTKSKIDALAKRFRDDLEGHHLTEIELNNIYELEDHIQLTLNTIVNKLEILLRGVITHPETRHVLLVGIKKEYKLLLARVNETRDYEDRPAGCLWPIIYRNIFERSELADDDPAYEIFGDWGVFHPVDYWKIGLLGEITSDEFKKLADKNLNIYQLGVENLAKIGVKTIVDWKKLKIFNSYMFRNFLSKKEIINQLTQLTRRLL